jgi:hypothetical protein
MKTLEQISLGYKSDKGAIYHNYLEIYEKYFSKYRNSLKTFLEIGLWEGESLRMWREYFDVGHLVGIDILDLSHVRLANTTILQGDQSNRDDLNSIITNTFPQFDIIIDDGGHMMHQMQITLGTMFKYLSPDGVYVIEDLHTCGNPSYNRGTDTETIDVLETFIKTGKIVSNCMLESEIEYLEQHIDKVNIEQGNVSKIAFITKKGK